MRLDLGHLNLLFLETNRENFVTRYVEQMKKE